MIGIVQYLQTNHPFSCLEIRFEDASKNPESEVKRIPKNRQKVHIWGAISIKGVVGYHTFRTNLTGIYFVDILKHRSFSR